MKKLAFASSAILILFMFSACNKTPQEMIIGKWKIETITNSEQMGEIELKMFNKINAEKINSELLEFSVENLKIAYPEEAVCTWEMSQDGKFISVIYPEDGEHKYEIISITKDELVWKEDFVDFFHTTTLKKVK